MWSVRGKKQLGKDWQRAESNRDPGKEGVSTGEGNTDSEKEEIGVKRPGDRNRFGFQCVSVLNPSGQFA